VTQWHRQVMKALGRVIVPVFIATLLHPLVSQRIPFTVALLYIKNLVYFHLMTQYWYHIEATIQYMDNYLKDFQCRKDVFSRFHASKSTQKLSKTLTMQLASDKQVAQESDPDWINLSVSAKHYRIDEDKMQIKSEIESHFVNQSDFSFGKKHLQNHFFNHI
jgi:hypothetical protein